MKSVAKNIVTKILWWQTRVLLRKNRVTVIGVVGSIGKTSTKFAIAQTLEASHRVRWQKGNYNDITSVPLVFFGQALPDLFNPLAWLKVFIDNQKQLANYPYDVVVVELGTDGPGQIEEFEKYLKLDIAVVTAIALEHMEFFKDLDAVAKEELMVAKNAKKLLMNTDLIDQKFIDSKLDYISYGTKNADYTASLGKKLIIKKAGKKWIEADLVESVTIAYSRVAAAAAADILKAPSSKILQGINSIKPIPGRLQLLKGLNGSLIIDDTYNASPDATKAALDTVYRLTAPQKIVLLGNMNELGNYSEEAHRTIGQYCDASQLDLVVTLGDDANKYLAEEAERSGCRVVRTTTPYEAADVIKDALQKDALVLAKGSQNGVYAEEAIKQLLANESDVSLLVRQSDYWVGLKSKSFGNKT